MEAGGLGLCELPSPQTLAFLAVSLCSLSVCLYFQILSYCPQSEKL